LFHIELVEIYQPITSELRQAQFDKFSLTSATR